MTLHTDRGLRPSLWVDDGFGTLTRITYDELLTRIVSGWREI